MLSVLFIHRSEKKILLLCGFPTENMRSTLISWVHVGIVDTPKKKFGFFCLCRNNKEFENQRCLLVFFQRKATRHFVVSFIFIAIFVQANEQKLWFGRDYFGRRSLLWHLPTDSNDVLAVTSVTERNSSATDKLVFISFSFLFFSLTFFTLILFFSLKMWGGEKEYNPCMMQQILHEMTRTITKPRSSKSVS